MLSYVKHLSILMHAEKILCQNTVSYFLMLETEVLHKATSKLFTSIETFCSQMKHLFSPVNYTYFGIKLTSTNYCLLL